ncbi:MAG: F0F1 ATP synthase subunit B [Timaviella obliquedivisa GSE-PSE-MK23-08B]|jgi:F-type H+-transporting ATPase subunit b|nr:F0F1 ATP synthase subunit B [Timaviella obliquedivisa GSE-PSE-MK23-08B]
METMGTLILLTAATAEEAGFGLNLNILDTNLINLAIVLGVVVYLARNFLGKTLAERRSQIELAIKDAEKRKQEASAALASQQQKLAQAKTEATRIKTDAEASAQVARAEIMAQSAQDIERLKASAAQDLNSQQERVMTELRQRVAALALEKVEAQLNSGLSADTQKQLVDRSIAMMGGAS